MLRYQTLFFLLLVVLFLPDTSFSEPSVQVSVLGVSDKLHENVMSRLRIYRYSQDSDLNDSEIRRLHKLAETDIKSALAPYGFYSVEVESSLTRSEDSWLAQYQVKPGQPVMISKISVSVIGEGAGLTDLLQPADMEFKEGQVLNQNLYEQGKKQLLRQALAHGFLDASYETNEIRINRKKYLAEIILELDTGPRYQFGEITSDQTILTDQLLDGFIHIEAGQPFSPKLLQELQRDLYKSDYFSSVIIEKDTTQTSGLQVPIEIKLEPLKTYNRYSFGVGYSTDTLAYVRVEWLNRLLNTRGHRIFSSLMLGQRESHAVFNYRIPVVDPRHNTLTGSVNWQHETWEDTVTTSYSAGILYDYSTPTHYYGFSLEKLNEDYRVGDTTGISQLLMPGLKWSWALADNIVTTGNGLRATIELVGADENVFSDATFVKLRAAGKAIISPFKQWRIIARGSFGTTIVDSIDSIPPSLRFYAGGEKSVRGYQYRSLGPRDSSDTVIGGRYLLTGGIECERQFTKLWRGAIFYDVGNAMDDIEVDLAHGVGAGIGLVLPFGQARLDFAYPLNDEGEAQYVYLSVGADL